MIMKRLVLCSLVLVFIVAGCASNTEKEAIQPVSSAVKIKEHDGKMSKVISQVYTTSPKVALTFNGLANEKTMQLLLNQLDQFAIKATFFVEGTRVAQEPELVKAILAKGHEVQNGTLTFADMSKLNYEKTYEEIYLTNQVFEEHLGYTPTYVRSRSGDVTENMQLATKALGMKAVVTSSINPNDRNMQSAQEIEDYISRFMNSGSVIHLNTYINPAVIEVIPLLAQLAKERDYQFAKLTDVTEKEYLVKSLKEIEGYDALQKNIDYQQEKPNIYYRKNTTKKEIALTFDDWASEERVKEVLAVLRKYNIKSTFFLIGKGVEANPQLARVILEEGHEIASHSYNHLDVTKMTPEEVQEDLIKAHEVMTFALQEAPLLYFRPAKGVIDDKTAKIISAAGIESIAMYDIASFDWKLEYSAKDIYERVMSRVSPGKVIVMHILDGTNTVEAMPLIIERLQSDGYTFEKMSTWIEEDSKKKVN
ncbi:MAG: polysaccharide deacetylase family protein [Lysinibacillus sp.]